MANETATVGRRLTLSTIVILGSLAGLPPLAIDLYLPGLPSLGVACTRAVAGRHRERPPHPRRQRSRAAAGG
jgi:hypothetical protein